MVYVVYAVFSVVVGALISVMSLSGMPAIMGIGSAIIALPIQLIFFGLGFYLLFQIKYRYVGVKGVNLIGSSRRHSPFSTSH